MEQGEEPYQALLHRTVDPVFRFIIGSDKIFQTIFKYTVIYSRIKKSGGAQAALDGGAQAERWPEWMRGFKDY